MAAAPSSSSSSDSDASSNRIHHEEDFKVDHNDENVLQKHVAFFDRNKDGVIYPWETFQGFRAIGCGIFLSGFASVFINMGLSSKTRPPFRQMIIVTQTNLPIVYVSKHDDILITTALGIILKLFTYHFRERKGKFPSLLFPIVVKNIHKSKHGSDSGVYDAEGRFVHEKFEEIFKKHARSNSIALTSEELSAMLKENRVKKDYKGWLASYTEWKILYILCKDENGLLRKDTVRAVYDGSLFEKMAMEKASSKKKS